jgi:hypothetical protein
MLCYEHKLWPEAEINFGSALESLLRVRYNAKSLRLVDLVEKFDGDSLFDALAAHDPAGNQCVTCLGDKVRTLRNAVHPNCWRLIELADVNQAQLTVVGVYHVLVVCSSRIADFQPSPDTTLSALERLGEQAPSPIQAPSSC